MKTIAHLLIGILAIFTLSHDTAAEPQLDGLANLFSSLLSGAFDILTLPLDVFTGAVDAGTALFDQLLAAGDGFSDTIDSILMSIADGITTGTTTVADLITGLTIGVLDAITNGAGALIDAVNNVIAGIVDAIGGIVEGLIAGFTALIPSADLINSLKPDIAAKIEAFDISSFIPNVGDLISNVFGLVSDIKFMFLDTFAGLFDITSFLDGIDFASLFDLQALVDTLADIIAGLIPDGTDDPEVPDGPDPRIICLEQLVAVLGRLDLSDLGSAFMAADNFANFVALEITTVIQYPALNEAIAGGETTLDAYLDSVLNWYLVFLVLIRDLPFNTVTSAIQTGDVAELFTLLAKTDFPTLLLDIGFEGEADIDLLDPLILSDLAIIFAADGGLYEILKGFEAEAVNLNSDVFRNDPTAIFNSFLNIDIPNVEAQLTSLRAATDYDDFASDLLDGTLLAAITGFIDDELTALASEAIVTLSA